MKCTIGAVLLASALNLPGFENLNFEQTSPPTYDYGPGYVPGWQNVGPNSWGDHYYNVNLVNLSGWPEAFVVSDDPQFWSWPTPLAGRFSMAFSASWPSAPTTNDLSGAWIAQTGTIEADAPWLTLLTDYTGPATTFYYPDPEMTNYFAVGYLTIYFDGTPVEFTLADAGTGPVGQPLRQLWADLSPFAGQTGELRIGIEGPHSFVIDNIALVPEPALLSLLAAVAGILGVPAIRRFGLRAARGSNPVAGLNLPAGSPKLRPSFARGNRS
jgi:hypothetical protein